MKRTAIALLGLTMSGVAYAGEEAVVETGAQDGAPAAEDRSWCRFFDLLGTPIYSSPDNPFLQELKFFGRVQYQWGYTDGDDFSGNGDEMRRLRLGAQMKFLKKFTLKGNVNLEDGGYRHTELGYDSFDELYLSYTLGEFAGFEDVKVGYGRRKVLVTQEVHTSSKKIKTVERSNIANYFYPERSTGVTLDASRGGVDWSLGVFSTAEDDELADWDEGTAYYAGAEFKALEGDFILDFVYNDADSTDVDTFGYEWAASAAYVRKLGAWELMLNLIYGETHDNDGVYGLVVMPSTYLIDDVLELVFRYQYAGSDGDNVKINSRNVRNTASYDGYKVPTGDDNNTIYGGLNWYLCGHHAKVMTGLEYETLDTPGDDLDAWTFWMAFRTYF